MIYDLEMARVWAVLRPSDVGVGIASSRDGLSTLVINPSPAMLLLPDTYNVIVGGQICVGGRCSRKGSSGRQSRSFDWGVNKRKRGSASHQGYKIRGGPRYEDAVHTTFDGSRAAGQTKRARHVPWRHLSQWCADMLTMGLPVAQLSRQP